jgi:hypothetical protein
MGIALPFAFAQCVGVRKVEARQPQAEAACEIPIALRHRFGSEAEMQLETAT